MPRIKSPQEHSGKADEGRKQNASILKETLEWLDRAEQAREVAGQLTDQCAKKSGP